MLALEKFVRNLRQHSVLGSAEERALLDMRTSDRRIKRRHTVVRENQLVDHSCLVGQGIVARSEAFSDGRQRLSALYLEGAMADLYSLPEPRARWNLVALTDCLVCNVPHEELRDVSDRFPAIREALWRDTIADACVLSKWISVLGRLDAEGRMAHLLCDLGRRLEFAGGGRRDDFTVPLTQVQFAEFLGITSVHAGRTLGQLRAKGLIELSRGAVRVIDLAPLESLAEYSDSYMLRVDSAANKSTRSTRR